jgi:hypothetical protein
VLCGVGWGWGKGVGVWISTRRSGFDEVDWGNDSELPNCICDGGCTDRLPESDGDEAGRSVNPPNVSSGARGLSSGKPHEVPATTSCGATFAKKRVSGRLGNSGGRAMGGRGLSPSRDGSNVRAA